MHRGIKIHKIILTYPSIHRSTSGTQGERKKQEIILRFYFEIYLKPVRFPYQQKEELLFRKLLFCLSKSDYFLICSSFFSAKVFTSSNKSSIDFCTSFNESGLSFLPSSATLSFKSLSSFIFSRA